MAEETQIERHPLEPFLPYGARMLMLGSFPPARNRWSMDFFYPNFINDMWRIFGLVFFNDKEHFVCQEKKTFKREDIIEFLTHKRIALYDTATEVVRTRNTAADKDLLVVTPTDIGALLRQIPRCEAVVTTGQKAAELIASRFGTAIPKVGGYECFMFDGREIRLYRMPSSSRAYPMKIERKAEMYAGMMREVFADIE